MADYTRSITVNAAPDRAFAWLSDPANMPRYTPMMTKAERIERGVRVTAERPDGETTTRDVRLTVDDRARTFAWEPVGSEYHGRMSVTEDGDGSRVTVEIHATEKATDAQVNDALGHVLGKIKVELDR